MSEMPGEQLLDGIRHIAGWNQWLSQRLGDSLGDERLRTFLGDQLRSTLRRLDIQVAHQEAKNDPGGQYRITYVVAHGGDAELEFTDLLRGGTKPRTLESVKKYHAGEWEQKVHVAYQTCLKVANQWNSVAPLIEGLLKGSHSPEEIAGLVEAIGDLEETTKLLALSSSWESVCTLVSFAYTVLGKCKEAMVVLDTLLGVYPHNADLHLALGNLFRGALYNANYPPPGSLGDPAAFNRGVIETTGKAGQEVLDAFRQSDPSFYRYLTDREYESHVNQTVDMLSLVTLEALGCSYGYAYQRAEDEFKHAMRLAKDTKTREQVWSAMSSLKMMKKAGD